MTARVGVRFDSHLSAEKEPACSATALTWIILWLIALAARLPAAFILPTAEQDGYSYAEIIARQSAKLLAGDFHVADLFGFWLPLYQFGSAVVNMAVGNALVTGKIVAALCGAACCVLVFALALKVTRSFICAWAAFALILCNPLHILYSAASMTETPCACLVLASLWLLLKDRWLGAAIFAALAAGVRTEAWALIPVLPMLQYARYRRVSPLLVGILLFPLLSWFFVCYLATGDAFAFFEERARYHANYLEFHPTRHGFTSADIRGDIAYFLLGANQVVCFASVTAMALLIFQWLRRPRRVAWPCLATAAYALAFFAFLLVAYVTKRQPVILPRYGLFQFALGLVLFAWLLQFLLQNWKPSWRGRLGAGVLIALCLWQMKSQLSIIPKVLDDHRAHQTMAKTLAAVSGKMRDDNWHCFSDDVAIRVLSGLPADRFVRSPIAPPAAWQGLAAFKSYLRDQHVAYLVFIRTEDSLPVKFYPDLGRSPQRNVGDFEFVDVAFSSFGPDVWLYCLRD